MAAFLTSRSLTSPSLATSSVKTCLLTTSPAPSLEAASAKRDSSEAAGLAISWESSVRYAPVLRAWGRPAISSSWACMLDADRSTRLLLVFEVQKAAQAVASRRKWTSSLDRFDGNPPPEVMQWTMLPPRLDRASLTSREPLL